MDQWLETKQLPVHFVSAAGVVYQDGKVLLIRSERRGWEFPGGIVEQGEALLDGLRREIFEESGIAAEPEAVTGIYQNLARKKGFNPLQKHFVKLIERGGTIIDIVSFLRFFDITVGHEPHRCQRSILSALHIRRK